MSDEHKMCRSKRRHSTYQAALFFADVHGLRPYKCPFCGGFHLSSKKVPSRTKRLAKEKSL